MRILFLSAEPPWPIRGGDSLLTYKLLEVLSHSHEIDLLFLKGYENCKQFLPSKSLRIFSPLNSSLKLKRFLQAISCFTPYPMVILTNHNYGLVKYVKESIKEVRPDIIIFNHIRTAWLIKYISNEIKVPCIYIAHNAESHTNESIANMHHSILAKMLIVRDLHKLTLLEKYILKTINACVVLTSEDQERLSSFNKNMLYSVIPPNIDIVGNRVDVSKNIESVLLVGSFLWEPKKLNAIWIAKNVMPIVMNKFPGVNLKIVGASASTLMKDVGELPYVELHSDVESVEPYYQLPSIFVVPERQESGIKLKTIEAASHGLPIVSTSAGAEGTGLKHDHSIVIADTTEDFASSIIDLLQNNVKRTSLGTNAYNYIQGSFSSAIIQEKYHELFNRIIP